MNRYKVKLFKDETYEVIELSYDDDADDETKEVKVFQGRLADCEAFIRLKIGGYL
jgi:hypothetical protein